MKIKGFSQFASTKEKKERKPINKRHLKYGSFATGFTVLFVAAVVLVNIVTTMLFERFPISLDLTGDSIYSISQETKDYISSLEVPVDITIMATESNFKGISDYTVQCAEILSSYSQYNPLITVRYKDLLSSPDFVGQYAQQNIATGDIIIEPAEGDHTRVKIVTLADIINVADDYSSYLAQYKAAYGGLYTHQLFNSQSLIVSSNAEQAITSAIMAVTDANPITVATLSFPGANESDVSGLTDLLDKNGYALTTLNIQTQPIPDDVDIIIIPAPKVDYGEAETEKISTWLTNSGDLERDLIYVASMEQGETPNLDALLYKYGITVESKLICETDSNHHTGYPNQCFQLLASENYRADIANPGLSIIVPNARAITTRFDLTDGYNTCESLITSYNTAALINMHENITSLADLDEKVRKSEERGTFSSVVLGRYKALNQETHISKFTNVIAIGSDSMINTVFMSDQRYNNGSFFISLINELSGKTEGVTIVPKKVKAKGVIVAENVKNSLNLTFAFIIPIAVLAVGTFVWIRRRHR